MLDPVSLFSTVGGSKGGAETKKFPKIGKKSGARLASATGETNALTGRLPATYEHSG
jgi:hypothetical protein